VAYALAAGRGLQGLLLAVALASLLAVAMPWLLGQPTSGLAQATSGRRPVYPTPLVHFSQRHGDWPCVNIFRGRLSSILGRLAA